MGNFVHGRIFFKKGALKMSEMETLKQQALLEIEQAKTEQELNGARVKYLGKTGLVSDLLKNLKDMPGDQKKTYGQAVNALKQEVEAQLSQKNAALLQEKIDQQLKNTPVVDLTIPSPNLTGSLHPITVTQEKLVNLFKGMGFIIETAHEIETEYNNFEAVNVPKNHPARDMQDTFYLENGQVLSTQTSSAQNRIMKKYGAPLKVLVPGRCFRNEELDASHENTFFQSEGMMIDKDISISNLIYFMKQMLSSLFEKEVSVRLRPGFFPFVEPGFELDCSCPYCGGKGCRVCKHSGWIELCPCGMIHPTVLKNGGIDPNEYQGFAFGLGLSRLTMMNYEIDDIRVLNGGNLKQLNQTKLK